MTATVLIEVDSIKVPNQAEAVTYHIFVVVSWEGGEPRNLGGEHSELRWFDIDEASRLDTLALSEYLKLFVSQALVYELA